jgi:hypothetical protein
MVKKGFVTEQDFREFTFTNAATLHTRNNPGFFKGTVVQQALADELGLERASPAETASMTLLTSHRKGTRHRQSIAKVKT